MATLQVRSIDDQLYKALGKLAVMENRSISQEVVAILKEHLSSPVSNKKTTEAFLELAGSWQDDYSAREIAQSIRISRKSNRRFTENL